MQPPTAGNTPQLDRIRALLPSDFTIAGFLGGGGQGSVYRGTFRGQPAALKVFEASHDPRRIVRELDLLQQIECPYLVKVLGQCQIKIDGQIGHVVAYEHLAGGDLRGLLRTDVPEAQLLTIGSQVSIAVETLWRARIVHRDIKPANIVAADANRYVLVDVGFARHVDRTALTAPGLVVCTPGYASPEQAAGRRSLTINSDVFSLGVTLYELACRVHPFNHNQNVIGRLTPTPLVSRKPALSPETARLIHQMMATRPADRPGGIAARFAVLMEA